MTKNNQLLPFTSPLLAIAATLLFSTSASMHADDWRGWNLGAAFIGLDIEVEVDTGDGGFYKTGSESDPGFVSLQGGYTFGLVGQAEGNEGWRFGLQFDLGLGDFDETASDPVLGDLEIDAELYLSGLMRFGYTWDRFWLYGLAGVSGSDFFVHPVGDRSTTVVIIGSVGLGAEYRFNENWSVNLELLSSHGAEFDEDFSGTDRESSVEHNSIKLGATYRF